MHRLRRYTGLIVMALTIAMGSSTSASPELQESSETLSFSNDAKQEDLHIYLLIGQSNMAGRAKVPEDLAGVIDRCVLLNKEGQWEPAKNPLNLYSTIRKGEGMQKLGPGYSFAKAMLKADPDIKLGLVVNARGGSKIDQWKEGSNYYKKILARAKAAMETGTLKGVLWHQGESDSGAPEGYLDKLESLVSRLRKDLDSPALPFIAGQVNNVPAVNEQIAKLPEAVDHTAYVKSEGLTCTDRWHFDTKSQLELGRRYAEAMLGLLAAEAEQEKDQ